MRSIKDRSEKNNKGITFVSNTEGNHSDKEESLSDVISLLRKKFNNSLKNLDRKWRTNVEDKGYDISSQSTCKGIQCFECERYGHFKTECPTFLKKHELGLSITWYESENDSDEENANKVMAYICKHDAKGESSDDNLSDEEIDASFRLLITKWEETCIEIERQNKTISVLCKDK